MKKIMMILTVLTAVSGFVSAQGFDSPSGWDSVSENDLQVSIFAGKFGGDRIGIGRDSVNDKVKVSNDDGTILGVRVGKDVEYWGWEVSLAGAFADEDSDTQDGISSGDASMLLIDFDLLLFPAGYDFAGETFRPFLCAGPGAAQYMTDSDYIDDETMFGYNVGCGIKFDLGENWPDLRVDYKWHFLSSDEYDDQERTEFTVGIGWKF